MLPLPMVTPVGEALDVSESLVRVVPVVVWKCFPPSSSVRSPASRSRIGRTEDSLADPLRLCPATLLEPRLVVALPDPPSRRDASTSASSSYPIRPQANDASATTSSAGRLCVMPWPRARLTNAQDLVII